MNIKQLKAITEPGEYQVKALLTHVSCETSKNGSSFNVMTFQDEFDEFQARKWDTEISDNCKVNQVLGLIVKAQAYNDKMTYLVQSYKILDEDPKNYSSDFTPEVDVMKNYLLSIISKIYSNKPEYKKVIDPLFKELDIEKNFFIWPAAKGMHHNVRSGLLFHTTSILRHAEGLIKSTKECYGLEVNEELIYTAIILHDFFKLKEYSMNEAGKGDLTKNVLIGHITMAAQYIGSLYYKGIISEELNLQLTHAVLGHHGELEYGSPVKPSTVESFIIHICDLFDSRLYMFKDELRKLNNGQLAESKHFGLGVNVYSPEQI